MARRRAGAIGSLPRRSPETGGWTCASCGASRSVSPCRAARDARHPRHDAGGGAVPNALDDASVPRGAAGAPPGRRVARVGRARVHGAGPAGPAQGPGGTVRRPDGRSVALAALLSAGPAVRLRAQVPDTAHAPPPIVTTGAVVVASDTTHRIRPIGACLRSLLLAGWGQAVTGRHVAGAVFATWEGVSAMMTLKARSEFHYLQEARSANVGAKRQEVQDWLFLWIFNHLFAGAETFVSAHLQDFPKDLKVRAFPGGVGLSVPVPRP